MRCVALSVVDVIAHGLERVVVAAAKQWKYKVKLTPGAAKRGAGAFDVDDVIQSMSHCVSFVCVYVFVFVCAQLSRAASQRFSRNKARRRANTS